MTNRVTFVTYIRRPPKKRPANKRRVTPSGKPGMMAIKKSIYRSRQGFIMHCRSSWEYKTAQYFDKLGVRWSYESKLLILGKEKYLPDFFIFNQRGKLLKIVEVKGRFMPADRAKTMHFQEALAAQGIPLEIWDGVKLKELGIL